MSSSTRLGDPAGQEQCFLCSATGHRKSECPTKTAGPDSGKPAGGSEKGQGKGEKGKGKGKVGGNKSFSPPSGSGSGSQPGGSPSTGDQAKGEPPAAKAMEVEVPPATSSTSALGSTGTTEEAALMGEVTTLLKSLRASIKAVSVKKVEKGKAASILIDGGATHCLRKARDAEEFHTAEDVTVSLASGSMKMRQRTQTGTLLTDYDVQGIIPMNDLAKLGATIKWDNTKCDIYIDDRKLPVVLDNGCPTVDGNVGRDLMRRVKMMYKKRYALRVLGAQRGLAERTGRSGAQWNVETVAKELCMEPEIEEYKELTSWFYWVPSELLERIPGERFPDPVQIPFNKRMRKRAEQIPSLTVHLFAGMETKVWKATESENSMVLLVELEKGQDLHNNHLYGWLCRLAREGRITTLLAGPPCRTVSLARYRNDDGPKPQYLRDGDTILWLRAMYLVILAYRGNPDVAVAVEQPADPESWKPPWHPRPPAGFASYLVWPETDLAKEMAGMKVIDFDQGPLGHKYPKPTQLLVSNAPELEELSGIKAPGGQVQGWPTHLYDRLDESKAAAEWAPGLRDAMVRMIERVKGKMRFVPRPGYYHAGEGTMPQPAGWKAETMTYALADHRPGADLSARNRRRHHRGQQANRPPQDDVMEEPFVNGGEASSASGVRSLKAKEGHTAAMWAADYQAGHAPFRRDCAVCLEAAGRDRARKPMKSQEGYCWSMDIAGPFKPGEDQVMKQPRYILVSCVTVPVEGGVPLTEGLQALQKKKLPRRTRVEFPLEREEDKERYGPLVEDPVVAAQEEGSEGGALTETELQTIKELDQRWKEFLGDQQDQVKMTHLTMVTPLANRTVQEVIKAVMGIHARLRMLQIPIYRAHTDRAREWVSKEFRAWARARDYFQTFSAGDEPCGHARVEREIGIIKGRIRALMLSSGAPDHYWPLAALHCGEERLRQQLWDLGVPTPELLPFGARALAKRKTWFQRAQPWRYPMERVQVWGPASDMSMTSNGYYVLTEGGHWLRTTILVVPTQMARTADELLAAHETEEQEVPKANALSDKHEVFAEHAVSDENAVSDEHEVFAEYAVTDEEAVLDDEAAQDDAQVAEIKDVLPNKETVGQASRAGAGKGPPFAEQVLDVNGELQLRELGPGEMQYVTEAPRYRMRQKTTPAQTSTKPSLCAMRVSWVKMRRSRVHGGVRWKNLFPSVTSACETTSMKSSTASRPWRWEWQRMQWS